MSDRVAAGVGLEIQSRLAEARNYNRWIAEQFLPHAGQRVLDVGCAIGNITQHFLDRELVIGLDVAYDFVDEFSRRFGDRPNVRTIVADIADPSVRELAVERLDTVVCANVLEHVEDDEAALANLAHILAPGGTLGILVPAHAWLFGTMDETDHHFRRYSRALLSTRVRAAGFVVHDLYEMNPLGIAGWLLNGKVLRRRLIDNGQYRLYDRVVPLLARIERTVRPPVGLSLVCIAKKPS